ncbi:hypothetical protein CW304_21685 [Bacillus sp. UFRGS-B20]|nr:hypothetical protein CW304_21685 [Bacillus sp. UFRGS-B20]
MNTLLNSITFIYHCIVWFAHWFRHPAGLFYLLALKCIYNFFAEQKYFLNVHHLFPCIRCRLDNEDGISASDVPFSSECHVI